MSKRQPLVSIGLPVYNGEQYLEDAIRSIQAQTLPDFELIISDNASTDRTAEIAQTWAASDARIRYYRAEENRGAAWNHNHVVALASGTYFKWAAHDDILAPEFLERCVESLEQDAGISLCHTQVKVIDEHGQVLGALEGTVSNEATEKRHTRFKNLILNDRYCVELFGVMRTDLLRKTPQIAKYIASDRVLRAELGLYGRFHEIPEYLFFSRDHPERSTRAMPAHHLRAAWYDPALEGQRAWPHWRIFIEYANCIRRTPLTRTERAYCFLHLARWLGKDWNWARLVADVFIAVRPQSWQWFYKLSKSGETWLAIDQRSA